MKSSITFVFAAVLLVGSQSPADGDKQSPAKQLQVNLLVFEGDPLGSREARTLKVVAEPRLTVLENRPFNFTSGVRVGEDAFDCAGSGLDVRKGSCRGRSSSFPGSRVSWLALRSRRRPVWPSLGDRPPADALDNKSRTTTELAPASGPGARHSTEGAC